MNVTAAKVLRALKIAKHKGITFDDFHRGFRLGGRVFELRRLRYEIETIMEGMSNGRRRARYVLRGEPR